MKTGACLFSEEVFLREVGDTNPNTGGLFSSRLQQEISDRLKKMGRRRRRGGQEDFSKLHLFQGSDLERKNSTLSM